MEWISVDSGMPQQPERGFMVKRENGLEEGPCEIIDGELFVKIGEGISPTNGSVYKSYSKIEDATHWAWPL